MLSALTILAIGVSAAAFIDAHTRRIPNALVAAMALAWIPFAGDLASAEDSFASALLIGGGLLAFSATYERFTGNMSLGGGDIKLLAVIALYLGFERTLGVILIACLVALAWSAVRGVVRRMQSSLVDGASISTLSNTFAFGPAIAFGAICVGATLFL